MQPPRPSAALATSLMFPAALQAWPSWSHSVTVKTEAFESPATLPETVELVGLGFNHTPH